MTFSRAGLAAAWTAFALAAAPCAAWAQSGVDPAGFHQIDDAPGDYDPFDVHLFDPELVLENARAIELSNEARREIIEEVIAVQADVTRMSLEAAISFGRLEELLVAEDIDEEAVIGIVNELLEIENETKRRYLRLAIRIRNGLSPDQRERLLDIRERAR